MDSLWAWQSECHLIKAVLLSGLNLWPLWPNKRTVNLIITVV